MLTPARLVYPCGVVWAKIVPTKQFQVFGLRWTFNTGPFNIKEHTVITVGVVPTWSGCILIVLDHGRHKYYLCLLHRCTFGFIRRAFLQPKDVVGVSVAFHIE
jgi:hypothetical protein